MSSTCRPNMVNFVPLAAEIDPVVWGTPANFNGFRVLAALLHDILVVGVSQTLRHWTEGVKSSTMFGRATITLGIGPHSSYMVIYKWEFNVRIGCSKLSLGMVKILLNDVAKLVTLNGVMALILRYFIEFSSFLGALRKSGWRCRHKKVHICYLISCQLSLASLWGC